MDLAHKMLSVAAAAAADGGAAVLQLARAYLGEVVAVDAGEVVFRRASGLERQPLAGSPPGLAAADLIEHITHRSHVLRVDEIHELAHLPATQAAMTERGLRSLLVLPVATGGVTLGAVVLGAHKPYAFVGVSQRTFGPLMAMVGISLSKALELTATASGRRTPEDAAHGARPGKVAELEAELERTRDSLRSRQAELDQAHARQQVEREQLTRELEASRARLAGVDEAFALAARLEAELVDEREVLAALRAERDRLVLELSAAVATPPEGREPSTPVEHASPQTAAAGNASAEGAAAAANALQSPDRSGGEPPSAPRSRKRQRRR